MKTKLKLGLCLALFFVFTVFFYGPISIYLSNADELKFGLGIVMKDVAIVSIVMFILIAGFSLIVPKKLFKWYMLLLLGVGIGFYVQGNYINYNYGVLDGKEINWSKYTGYGFINTAIWAVCILVPFIIYLVIRKKGDALINKVVVAICLFLVAIQIPAFISQAVSYKKKDTEALVITDNEMFTYAPDDNIVVFLLDCMDEVYYQDYLTRHPEFEAENPGFVHYDNAMAGGARTMLAMPVFYTGQTYERQNSYSDYIKEIFKGDDNLLKKMSDAGYDVRVYSESLFFPGYTSEYVSNFETVTDPVTSENILTRKLYKLSLFKFVPHFLKPRFWMMTSDFEQAMKRDNTYEFNDPQFYDKYYHQHMTIDKSKKKTFTVYHLEGNHRPFDMDENCAAIEKSARKKQMAGVFRIVKEMLDEMKEKGIYDSSTILITADHGDFKQCQWMMCMLKEAGAEGECRYSHAPISAFDYSIYLAGLAGQTMTNKYGVDMLSLAEDEKRERHLFRNTTDNSKPVVMEFVTNDDVSKYKKLKKVNEYVDDGEVVPYILGDRLGFDADDTGNPYAVEGFADNHGFRTRLRGPRATLVIPFAEKPDKKLTCDIEIHERTEQSYGMNCVIKANGVEVYRGVADDTMIEKGISFDLDKSIFKDNTLQLDFEFPDLPEEEMNLELTQRTTTISIVSIVIE
ncbi:MAG: sulfatase-like hydrolase/transferase [Eubacterium sp.]|nr:sulfatase-like hydrolase/transferase [Eubacterium sp.]